MSKHKESIECFLCVSEGDPSLSTIEEMIITNINGLGFHDVEDMRQNIFDTIQGFVPESIGVDMDGMKFTITNFSYQEGQMTFPETGQWDFPPHWEMDIELTEITKRGEARE